MPNRVNKFAQTSEFAQVPDIPQITAIMDAVVLPAIGGIALIVAKFAHGEAIRLAERLFCAALIFITLATLRTVINCDQVWLVHTTTLAVMIVGGLAIPGQHQSASIER